MDYAAAVNEEIRDLVRRRRRRRPDRRALPAGAAREGARIRRSRRSTGRSTASTGTTALHIVLRLCGDRARDSPTGYSFLRRARRLPRRPDLDRGRAAAPRPAVLERCPGKTIMLGVLDLGDPAVETPEVVAERIRAALRHVAAGAPDPRARLRHEVPAARGRVRQAARDGRRRRGCARRALTRYGCHSRIPQPGG